MVIKAVPRVNSGRLVVALVHAPSRCNIKEQGSIARIRDADLPISQWWSFLRQADRQRPEPYAPEKINRHVYDPAHGVNFQATPLGNSFILAGGDLVDRVPELLTQICRVNTRRFVDLEFHFPLDAIGSGTLDPDKHSYVLDPYNQFSRVLREMRTERGYGAEIFLDGETLGRFPGRLSIYLQWHMSTERMIECLRRGETVN